MSDRIVLAAMAFQGRHGVLPHEKVNPQRFEVDVELILDLTAAGSTDDLERTVDYRRVYETVRGIVQSKTFELIEAVAGTICDEILKDHAIVDEVVVRVRKPEVELGGPLAHAAVELRRRRGSARS
jgi:dihydroneopterin aldolase